jgi:hypothetical protein
MCLAPIFVDLEPMFDFVDVIPIQYLWCALSYSSAIIMDLLIVAFWWIKMPSDAEPEGWDLLLRGGWHDYLIIDGSEYGRLCIFV